MTYTTSKTRTSSLITLVLLVAQSSCAGTFTSVPMPSVTRNEIHSFEASVEPMGTDELVRVLESNYRDIAFQELGGLPGETLDEFTTRASRGDVSGAWFASVTPQQIQQLARNSAGEAGALAESVDLALLPLGMRLERVGRRIAAAAQRPDIVFELDPAIGMNAAAPAGFAANRVLVGPQLVLVSRSEDALAFVLGHEVAHIVHGHTRSLQVQSLLVGTLKLAAALAVVALDASARQQGFEMSPQEFELTSAAVTTLVGGTAEGAIRLSGFPRDQEREADYFGLEYAIRASYRAEGSIASFRTFHAINRGAGRGLTLPLLANHPTDGERAVRMEKWIQERAGSSDTPSPGVAVATRSEDSATTFGLPAEPAVPPETAGFEKQACWHSRGANRQECTTCCREGSCDTRCSAVTKVALSTEGSMPNPAICWNADSMVQGIPGVCTTCCTSRVSCKTTCSRP